MVQKKSSRPIQLAHLSGGYMLTAMIGFVISAIYVLPRYTSYGIAFMAFFAIMFISSMITMTYGPDESMHHFGHLVEKKRQKSASAPAPRKKSTGNKKKSRKK